MLILMRMLQLVLLLLGSNIFAKTLSVVVGLAVGAAVGAQVCPAALQGVQFCVCASRVSVVVLMLR